MKKFYFFILCFGLISIQNTFSQINNENKETKSSLNQKTPLQLMGLDSVTYSSDPSQTNIFQYDNRGNLTLRQSAFHKDENTYNQDSLLIRNLFYLWDYDSNYFRAHESTEFTYDNNSNLSQDIMSIFLDTAWFLNVKNTYEYTNNLLTTERSCFFDLDSNNWIYSSKTVYTYNSNNDITEQRFYYIENGIDELSNKTTNTYDANNNLTLSLYESYQDSLTLSYGTRTNYTYNNNLLTMMLTESYSVYDSSIWRPSYKQEYTYNANSQVATRLNYMYNNSSSQFVLHNLDSLTYDNNNNYTQIKSYINYNQVWSSNQKTTNTFNYSYAKQDLLIPKPAPRSLSYVPISEYNNMITEQIQGYNYTPGMETNWVYDTNVYHYTLKTVYLSLSDNITFDGTNLTVYPNPTSKEAKITLSGIEQNTQISLIDIQGRTIKSINKKPIDNKLELTLDVSTLKKGTYILNIRSGRLTQSKKLIIY